MRMTSLKRPLSCLDVFVRRCRVVVTYGAFGYFTRDDNCIQMAGKSFMTPVETLALSRYLMSSDIPLVILGLGLLTLAHAPPRSTLFVS